VQCRPLVHLPRSILTPMIKAEMLAARAIMEKKKLKAEASKTD
jgi:hypothetical protein